MMYVIVEARGSHCPECKKVVELLSPNDLRQSLPSFYICSCGWVGQVGVGPVHRVPTPRPYDEE